jgi:predicted nuclease of predicted toxin-antitoxin system
VCEVGLDAAEDAAILDFARRNDRTCVTLDHDFHAHLAIAQSGSPSVVLLRIEGLKSAEQAQLIREVWTVCEEAIAQGAAVSANSGAIRVRRLPLR